MSADDLKGQGLTEKQARDYAEEMRQRIAPEWTVDVVAGWHVDRSPEDVHASIEPSQDYLHATLFLGSCHGDGRTAQEQREAITHELVHLLFHDYHKVAEETTFQLGTQAGGMVRSQLDHHRERAVERFAVLLARD